MATVLAMTKLDDVARAVTSMSTKIKIESGIPIPMVQRKCLDFPFAEMAVGDSFAVVKAERLKLDAALHYVNRRKWHDRKYISRIEGDVIRVWRVQ